MILPKILCIGLICTMSRVSTAMSQPKASSNSSSSLIVLGFATGASAAVLGSLAVKHNKKIKKTIEEISQLKFQVKQTEENAKTQKKVLDRMKARQIIEEELACNYADALNPQNESGQPINNSWNYAGQQLTAQHNSCIRKYANNTDLMNTFNPKNRQKIAIASENKKIEQDIKAAFDKAVNIEKKTNTDLSNLNTKITHSQKNVKAFKRHKVILIAGSALSGIASLICLFTYFKSKPTSPS